MLGHSHALSGAVTGLAVGIATHMTLADTAALGGLTAGMALLPDLDACGSSPARSLGFLSEAVSRVVRRLSGGHRHVTHSVAGIAAFTALAWLAVRFRADWAGKAGLALLAAVSMAAWERRPWVGLPPRRGGSALPSHVTARTVTQDQELRAVLC